MILMQREGAGMSGATRLNVEYFSDKLENKLEEIENFPCTLIEAASGFGKTTAVRHFLEEKEEEGCRIITYLGGNVRCSWK